MVFKNLISPRQVFKSTAKKFEFLCDICDHYFVISLNHVTSEGKWCIFCANQKLCNDDNCVTCFEKSFASHTKSSFWSEKNSINARSVFSKSNLKYNLIAIYAKKNLKQ